MSSRRPGREDIQFAIICALPLEYDAAALAFDELWLGESGKIGGALEDHNIHAIGRIGHHNAALILLPGIGKVNAAGVTSQLRSSYTGLKLAILLGVCGGVPSPGHDKEILLGDVIISKRIVQYDLGRQYPNGFIQKDGVHDNPSYLSKDIQTLLATIETRLGMDDLRRRTAQILGAIQQDGNLGHQINCERPKADSDVLFEPDYVHRHRKSHNCHCSGSNACDEAIKESCEQLQCDVGHRVPRGRSKIKGSRNSEQEDVIQNTEEFQIHVGTMGSGDTVMKSGQHRDRIAARYGMIAFEMEGAGMWDEVPFLAVKGVCDYADSHKNKSWQSYAAAMAASTTKALLERYPRTSRLTTTHTWCLIPYNENPDFVGRSRIFDRVKHYFGHTQDRQQPTTPRTRVALHGLGGIGKTQIALAYIFWIRQTYHDISVFWVHASTEARFRQAYALIAQECDIPGHKDPKADVLKLVKTWLERQDQGRWLMVIDNADDAQLFFPARADTNDHDLSAPQPSDGLGHHVPECPHGLILITTRNKQAASKFVRGTSLIEVGNMNEHEAHDLLHKILDDKIAAEDAAVLATKLEHLPLALSQAAAFIQENSISITEYIQLLEEGDNSLVNQLSEPFEAVGRDSNTPHAVTATWMVSFRQIQHQSPLAGEILSVISFLDRQAIPKYFVSTYCRGTKAAALQNTTAEVTKALGILKAFSFITEARNSTIDMHRLVQLVTRKWVASQKVWTEFAGHALKTMADIFPYGEHNSRDICRDFLPHGQAVLRNESDGIKDRGVARASLLYCMSGYYLYRGNWKEAEKGFKQSSELRKQSLGEDHADTLASLGNLSLVLWNQGRWKEAEELGSYVIDMREKALGEEHPDTLTSILIQALTFWSQGRWEEAEKLGTQVMEKRKKVLGDEHLDTLMSMQSLALTFWSQGRWKEAETLEVKVVQGRKKLLGEEHPDTLMILHILALTLWSLGRWKESEQIGLQVIEKRKKVFGGEHPDTIMTMHNLALTYIYQGRWDDAEELGVQIIELRKRVLGEEHPDTLMTKGNLILTYMSQGQWKKAEELETVLLSTRARVLGQHHPDTLYSMDHLSSIYRNQSQWQKAEELGTLVMETRKKVLGEEHPHTLESMHNLACTWKGQGRLEAAIQLMRHCLQARTHRLGVDHPDSISSSSLLTDWEGNPGFANEELSCGS